MPSHGYVGVKLDCMIVVGLEVHGFCVSPSDLHLIDASSCPVGLWPNTGGV